MRGKNGHDQACHSEKITNWFLSWREMNHTIYLYSAGEEGQTHLIWKSVSAWFIIYWESHCSVIQWSQSCQEPALNLIKLITTSILQCYNTYANNGNFSTVYWCFCKTRAARFGIIFFFSWFKKIIHCLLYLFVVLHNLAPFLRFYNKMTK